MTKVWITGGGSGIGAAVARKFLEDGATVWVSGRNKDKLQSVAENILVAECDITDRNSIERTLDHMGTPEVAILNAGTYTPGSTVKSPELDFRDAMEVNYFGTLNCLQALIPRMQDKGGHIAVVGSVAGYIGLPNAAGYGPSKAALISLCESMRAELHNTKVKFQLINPGFVRSPLTDKNTFKMPFLLEPEEAAANIMKGLQGNAFEIAFPKIFAWQMKLMKWLPYGLYFPLIAKATRT